MLDEKALDDFRARYEDVLNEYDAAINAGDSEAPAVGMGGVCALIEGVFSTLGFRLHGQNFGERTMARLLQDDVPPEIRESAKRLEPLLDHANHQTDIQTAAAEAIRKINPPLD